MKPVLIILLLVVAGGLAVHAELPADWSTNYTAVLSPTATEQRPMLVYFTASWCGPCKLLTRITLTDPVVLRSLSNVDHVAMDIDEHPDLASKFGIQAVPTLILLSAGQEVDRTTGFRPVDGFLEWLTNGVNEAKLAATRLTLAKNELAEADQLLASTNINSTRLAASELFDLCAEPGEALVQAATGRLKTLAGRDPIAVLDGLNDSRLATRIQAANVLRYAFGDTFDVDPWCDADTLRKEANVWRDKLAKSISPQQVH
jgi:thioredoxin-like negative regulator of GroEL